MERFLLLAAPLVVCALQSLVMTVDDRLALFEYDERSVAQSLLADAVSFCTAHAISPAEACAAQLVQRASERVVVTLPVAVGGSERELPYRWDDTVEGWADRAVRTLRDEEGVSVDAAARARPSLVAALRQRLVEHAQTVAAAEQSAAVSASSSSSAATVADLPPMPSLSDDAVRPRIFVYTLPARLVDDRAAQRHDMYRTEWVLWQRVLRSPMRTLNPSEADLFYVPLLGASRFRNKVDWGAYAQHAQAVLRHVRSTFPYWNRTAGADHVWAWGHDLGAAFAPRAARRSIFFTVFNDVAALEHERAELFAQYAHDPETALLRVAFDPHKDIVVPPHLQSEVAARRLYRAAAAAARRPLLPRGSRTTLLFFRGAIFLDDPYYSRGVRQLLWSRFGDGAGGPDVQVEKHHVAPALYVAELERSVFCACPAGWQIWSPRAYAAILSGCIPLFFSLESAVLPFEAARAQPPRDAALDYDAFSLTMTRDDVPTIERTLRALAPARIERMQRALRDVALRFTYQDKADFRGADAANVALLGLADRYAAVSRRVRWEGRA